MELDVLWLFVYTVNEYKKFSKKLIKHDLIDSFNDEDYVEINTKLMLLRKYAVYGENVYIKKILSLMIDKYPDEKEKLNKLLIDYENVEKQNIQFVLSDGTKRSLYETIEDVMCICMLILIRLKD